MRLTLICVFWLCATNHLIGQVKKNYDKITGQTTFFTNPQRLWGNGPAPSTWIFFSKGFIDSSIRMNIYRNEMWVSNGATIDILYADQTRENIVVDTVLSSNPLFPSPGAIFIGSYVITTVKEISAFKLSDPDFLKSINYFLNKSQRRTLWANLYYISIAE